MSDLIVIVPSRGRPYAARQLAETFKETCQADTELMIVLDDNDPDINEYESVLRGAGAAMCVGPSRTMVQALNGCAVDMLGEPFALGFMGDDHRPRTVGWDALYLEELRKLKTGIVYGNDLFQKQNIPTQCAMTTDIVKTLGYMAPPCLTHMYVDNFWLSIGRTLGFVRYLPNVIVEHMHPFTGKVEWSEGHIRVNSQDMYDRDQTAYQDYLADERFVNDVRKLRELVKA